MDIFDIKPGDRVKIDNGSEGIVIMIQPYRVAIHDSNNMEPYHELGPQVNREWCQGNGYKFVDNIAEYQGKHHQWYESEYIVAIISNKPAIQATISPGCFCSICSQFSPLSEVNQPDNTFKCYSCRVQPLRAYY